MNKKLLPIVHATLNAVVGGGQTITTLDDGRKCFVWGGLPDEEVDIQITKKKSKLSEGVVTNVVSASEQRIAPHDPESFLSTSPWQIMKFESEQHYKAALIEEAFELHDIVLPNQIEIYSDDVQYEYRNKVEFSWYWNKETEQIDLAFFRRGTHGKIPVEGTSLARPEINTLAREMRDLFRKKAVKAYSLKTLLIRCDREGKCVWQLYVKDQPFNFISQKDAESFSAIGGEIIYSDPRSPASKITKRLTSFGDITLTDTILDVPFRYATEGFFQVNIPVYEQALRDMKSWTDGKKPILDLYSGVGTIGLTIGGDHCTLVEIDENAVREMRRNIKERGSNAKAILAPSEGALDEITDEKLIIVDPPRAGLHADVIAKLLEAKPARIIYLSCNPTTQARDVALLCVDHSYGVAHHKGYNFFPRTPHIEHLVVLDRKA